MAPARAAQSASTSSALKAVGKRLAQLLDRDVVGGNGWRVKARRRGRSTRRLAAIQAPVDTPACGLLHAIEHLRAAVAEDAGPLKPDRDSIALASFDRNANRRAPLRSACSIASMRRKASAREILGNGIKHPCL